MQDATILWPTRKPVVTYLVVPVEIIPKSNESHCLVMQRGNVMMWCDMVFGACCVQDCVNKLYFALAWEHLSSYLSVKSKSRAPVLGPVLSVLLFLIVRVSLFWIMCAILRVPRLPCASRSCSRVLLLLPGVSRSPFS